MVAALQGWYVRKGEGEKDGAWAWVAELGDDNRYWIRAQDEYTMRLELEELLGL